MAKWTIEEHLTFDIAFALKKVTIPGLRKALTEEHRIAIAKAILDHLNHGLCILTAIGGLTCEVPFQDVACSAKAGASL